VLAAIVDSVSHTASLEAEPEEAAWFTPGRGARLKLNGAPFGWMGEISRSVRDAFELQDPVLAAEVDLQMLEQVTVLWPSATALPQFPAMARDLNLVLDEQVSWHELNELVRGAAGPLLEQVEFVDQYRGQQIAAGKKSYVFRMQFRSADRTLQAGEVDAAIANVLGACQTRLKAVQR
jgi:phenylalanyl-tRNA synthetase beta chain